MDPVQESGNDGLRSTRGQGFFFFYPRTQNQQQNACAGLSWKSHVFRSTQRACMCRQPVTLNVCVARSAQKGNLYSLFHIDFPCTCWKRLQLLMLLGFFSFTTNCEIIYRFAGRKSYHQVDLLTRLIVFYHVRAHPNGTGEISWHPGNLLHLMKITWYHKSTSLIPRGRFRLPQPSLSQACPLWWKPRGEAETRCLLEDILSHTDFLLLGDPKNAEQLLCYSLYHSV